MDAEIIYTTQDNRNLNKWGQQVISCTICGEGTTMLGTKLCDGCWEVEHRLEGFLEHPKARQLVRELLHRADGAPMDWTR